MNERERADWLARTIDDILRGSRPATPPDGLDERDVDGLLRAASTRMNQGSDSARSALQYEGTVWREVLHRLDRRRRPRPNNVPTSDPARKKKQRDEAPESELEDLRDIVAMRRQMTGDLLSLSDTHRDNVWNKIESRLEHRPKKRGLFWFFRRSNRDADRLAPAIDAVALFDQTPAIEPEFDGLIATAQMRKGASHFASVAADEGRDRIWDRVHTRIERRDPRAGSWWTRRFHPRWAFSAAAMAIVVAAIGLVPFTGLANHPVADAARHIGDYIGVSETTSAPPPPTSDATVVTATQVSAAEASELMGVSVADPVPLAGFDLTSSRYFPEPITSDRGGTYVLTYQGTDPGQSLVIYQELASEINLAIGLETATNLSLADGTPSTYVEGAWEITGTNGLSWEIGRTQTLTFQRDEVRTIIRYTGPAIEASILTAIANLLA